MVKKKSETESPQRQFKDLTGYTMLFRVDGVHPDTGEPSGRFHRMDKLTDDACLELWRFIQWNARDAVKWKLGLMGFNEATFPFILRAFHDINQRSVKEKKKSLIVYVGEYGLYLSLAKARYELIEA